MRYKNLFFKIKLKKIRPRKWYKTRPEGVQPPVWTCLCCFPLGFAYENRVRIETGDLLGPRWRTEYLHSVIRGGTYFGCRCMLYITKVVNLLLLLCSGCVGSHFILLLRRTAGCCCGRRHQEGPRRSGRNPEEAPTTKPDWLWWTNSSTRSGCHKGIETLLLLVLVLLP